jgi:dihydrolipoamide dehydrogenase
VIGGGIIGLEMACVYDALGVKVTVVELSDGLMPGTDRDLVRPLQKAHREALREDSAQDQGGETRSERRRAARHLRGTQAVEPQMFDRVLVAVGRTANGNAINAAVAGVNVRCSRHHRRRQANAHQRAEHIRHRRHHRRAHAGAPRHASGQGGRRSGCRTQVIVRRALHSRSGVHRSRDRLGRVTETEAKERGIAYGKGSFPWAASGRSLALNRDEGFTKILFDKDSHRVIGAGIVGTNAGELIAEVGLPSKWARMRRTSA